MTSSTLPNPGAEIHPWMPRHLHDNNRGNTAPSSGANIGTSPLGQMCLSLGVSIHDREKVWDAMKSGAPLKVN